MEEIEYRIKFPKTEVGFNSTKLTFKINHIRSRKTSVLYFILHCYDINDEEIYAYTSPRWVIAPTYRMRYKTFEIKDSALEQIAYTQIELRTIGITSENPLYFSECMLNEGEEEPYSVPHQQVQAKVGYNNSRYVNLYDSNGNYLQVIRPTGRELMTNLLTKSECTVLAPHLDEESDIDDPVNVFMEFINQVDQRIDVLR